MIMKAGGCKSLGASVTLLDRSCSFVWFLINPSNVFTVETQFYNSVTGIKGDVELHTSGDGRFSLFVS